MVLQTLVTLLFVIVFGLRANKFEDILIASAPYFWSFLAITVSAMIVSRIRFAGQFSGYRTPFFPVLPVVFIVSCLFMVERSTRYMWSTGMHFHALAIGVWVVLGVLLSVVLAKSGSQSGTEVNRP